jgi:hypothetical protein
MGVDGNTKPVHGTTHQQLQAQRQIQALREQHMLNEF